MPFDIIKPPMKASNKGTWSKQFDEIEAYIKSLHMKDPNKVLQLVVQVDEPPIKRKKKSEREDTRATTGVRKRGFLGFLINIQTYRAIFRVYVEERRLLKYLLGHKLSQEKI